MSDRPPFILPPYTVDLRLGCNAAPKTLLFQKTCPILIVPPGAREPYAGLAVLVEFFRNGAWNTITSGTTDADGKIVFFPRFGAGSYRVTYTATSPWRSGQFNYGVSNPCVAEKVGFSVGLLDDYTCCSSCGPVKQQLYLTDAFQTVPMTLTGGGIWKATTSGSRSHVDDSRNFYFDKRISITGGTLFDNCCIPGADECYFAWAKSDPVYNSGTTSVSYALICSYAEDGSPVLWLQAAYGKSVTSYWYDYMNWYYWCWHYPDRIPEQSWHQYPGTPYPCQDYPVGLTLNYEKINGICQLSPPDQEPDHNIRVGLYYPSGTSGYGVGSGGPFSDPLNYGYVPAFGKIPGSIDDCKGDFSKSFTLEPGKFCIGNGCPEEDTYQWAFELPVPYENYQGGGIPDIGKTYPEPPGGMSITISS